MQEHSRSIRRAEDYIEDRRRKQKMGMKYRKGPEGFGPYLPNDTMLYGMLPYGDIPSITESAAPQARAARKHHRRGLWTMY